MQIASLVIAIINFIFVAYVLKRYKYLSKVDYMGLGAIFAFGIVFLVFSI